MLVAVCLERTDHGDGKIEMMLAGATHLQRLTNPPEPMLLAAGMLRIPGFDMDTSDVQVH